MCLSALLLFVAGLIQLSDAHMDLSGCGETKKCIFVPAGCQDLNSCHQVFTYRTPNSDGWTEMELYSSNDNPNNNYVAVGFSEDDIMGDDYVTHCAFSSGGQPELHVTCNFGKSNNGPREAADLTLEKENLQLVHAHKTQEGMFCAFKQKSVMQKNTFLPNLDAEKVIFLARGNARKPRALGIHSLDPASPDFPFISDQRVNVGAPESLSTGQNGSTVPPEQPTPAPSGMSKATRFLLVKWHAALMIFAWLFLVAVAVVSARYLRDHFPKSQPCGLKIWFHIHRMFNILAVALILLATFLIFFAKDFAWRGPSASADFETNTSPSSVHTLLGVIAIVLATVQPFMALARCAPDTGARPIFNWTHRSVGLIAIVGAFIAILIGANSFKALWADANWAFWLVAFFIVVTILTIVIFEVLSQLKKKPSQKTIDMQMNTRMHHPYNDGPLPPAKVVEKKPVWALSLLFLLFVCFAFCIALALVILLFV